jgi:hypothetical protein
MEAFARLIEVYRGENPIIQYFSSLLLCCIFADHETVVASHRLNVHPSCHILPLNADQLYLLS